MRCVGLVSSYELNQLNGRKSEGPKIQIQWSKSTSTLRDPQYYCLVPSYVVVDDDKIVFASITQ